MESILTSLSLGLLATTSPCVLPLYPGFLAYISLIEAAVPAAKAKGAPGTAEFRAALRDALEASKEVVGVHGVFNMTPNDHFGLDDRSRVLIRIEGGAYKLVAQ